MPVQNKKEQIIVRLDSKTKQQLQEVADNLNIDMSKLIRDKIDEIIVQYNINNNKRLINEVNNFVRDNSSNIQDKIITNELIEEVRMKFKEMFLEKMKKDIGDANISEILKFKNE